MNEGIRTSCEFYAVGTQLMSKSASEAQNAADGKVGGTNISTKAATPRQNMWLVIYQKSNSTPCVNDISQKLKPEFDKATFVQAS